MELQKWLARFGRNQIKEINSIERDKGNPDRIYFRRFCEETGCHAGHATTKDKTQ